MDENAEAVVKITRVLKLVVAMATHFLLSGHRPVHIRCSNTTLQTCKTKANTRFEGSGPGTPGKNAQTKANCHEPSQAKDRANEVNEQGGLNFLRLSVRSSIKLSSNLLDLNMKQTPSINMQLTTLDTLTARMLVSHRTSWGTLPQTPVFSLRSAR
jgi:hypothetical protein